MLRIRLETPNHVRLIHTPSSPEGLSRALGETHRRYFGVISARRRASSR
jgi:putative transposase